MFDVYGNPYDGFPHEVAQIVFSLCQRTYVIYCDLYGSKICNIQNKNCDVFLIFDYNIECWYFEAVPVSTHKLCFMKINRKNNTYTCKLQFYYIKVGFDGV